MRVAESPGLSAQVRGQETEDRSDVRFERREIAMTSPGHDVQIGPAPRLHEPVGMIERHDLGLELALSRACRLFESTLELGDGRARIATRQERPRAHQGEPSP